MNKSHKKVISREDLKFITYLEHSNLPSLEIKKEFADSNDMCLSFEIYYTNPPVITFVSEWFHVDDNSKISSLDLFWIQELCSDRDLPDYSCRANF